MQRPASNRAWCRRWDELSTRLLEELQKPECDIERVTELVRERRRLTTAGPVNRPGELEVPEDEQRQWLHESLERERLVAEQANEVRDRIGRSLTSIRAGRAVRSRFGDSETKPRVFSTRL